MIRDSKSAKFQETLSTLEKTSRKMVENKSITGVHNWKCKLSNKLLITELNWINELNLLQL